MVAVAHKIPILPVSVNGSRRVLPKGSLVVKQGKIHVVIGEPIDTSGYTTDTVDELIDKTHQRSWRISIASRERGWRYK